MTGENNTLKKILSFFMTLRHIYIYIYALLLLYIYISVAKTGLLIGLSASVTLQHPHGASYLFKENAVATYLVRSLT